MLNKQELTDIICDRCWIFRIVIFKHQFVPLKLGTSTSGMLAIVFHRDGTIGFPTNLAFKPSEYRGWDFDEANQEIIFLDTNHQESKRGTVPKQWAGKSLKIDSIGEDTLFTSEPYVEKRAIKDRILGGTNLCFIPDKNYEFEAFQSMARAGFATKLVDSTNSIINFLSVVYDYVAMHPQLEKIIISQISLASLKEAPYGKLIFTNDNGNPSFDYLAGNRGIVMELLTTVLSENNKRRLNPEDFRSEDDLLQEILTNRFSNRYALVDLPTKP